MKWKYFPHYWIFVMGNALVIGGFPSQRASDEELWCFLWCQPEHTAEQTVKRQVNVSVLVLIWRRCNDAIIFCEDFVSMLCCNHHNGVCNIVIMTHYNATRLSLKYMSFRFLKTEFQCSKLPTCRFVCSSIPHELPRKYVNEKCSQS